jgi:3-dehydroquinate synthase
VTLEPALTVRYAGGAGNYPVYIERGALERLAEIVAYHCPDHRLAVIADARVAECVPCPLDAPVVTFPPGEGSKTREQWSRLTDRLLELGLGSDSAIVALGGGVTGDLAGFVAATYHRGLPLVQVPTSLLAMVDASIGGKTGVDTPAGKNMVGAFHHPVAVVMDPAVLGTLPLAGLRTGLAEAIKHALIADADHFAWLRANLSQLLARDLDALDQLIRVSAAIKAAIVEEDERETGRRATLNAGHTVGHAIEAATEWRVPHGEAVAIGLVVEADVAERLGIAALGTAVALREMVGAAGLPASLPRGLTPESVVEAARRDKKNRRSAIRCALPAGVGGQMDRGTDGQTDGSVSWTTAVPDDVLLAALEANREGA